MLTSARCPLVALLFAIALLGCNRVTIWRPPAISIPEQPNVVILVHAIWRWPGYSMSHLLEEGRRRGYEVVYFRYSGLLDDLETNVERLAEVLNEYRGRQVNFITHSYGGLIVRRLLDAQDQAAVNRLVMIGTPNQGSAFAQSWDQTYIYKIIFGLGGLELTPSAVRRLPEPSCEFGIIAGFGSDINPFPLGDNDGVVGVSETYLPGAREFRLVEAMHESLPHHPEVVRASYDFLETGSFGLDPAH